MIAPATGCRSPHPVAGRVRPAVLATPPAPGGGNRTVSAAQGARLDRPVLDTSRQRAPFPTIAERAGCSCAVSRRRHRVLPGRLPRPRRRCNPPPCDRTVRERSPHGMQSVLASWRTVHGATAPRRHAPAKHHCRPPALSDGGVPRVAGQSPRPWCFVGCRLRRGGSWPRRPSACRSTSRPR